MNKDIKRLLCATIALAGALCAREIAAAETKGDGICNNATGIQVVRRDGAAIGVTLTSGGETLSQICFGPNGLWKAKRCEARQEGEVASLRFSGFDTSGTGGTPKLAEDSFIEFSLKGQAPFPWVKFSLGFDAFDETAWQAALAPPGPLYYLTCRVPDAKMFYLGGGLIPSPEFESYPLTRQGCMSGNWSPRWSYAAALAGFGVPAFGLWNPDSKVFVGYDFGEARHTDRSDKYLAPAYCAGEGKHQASIFCLVHPYQADWIDLTYPKEPVRIASRFELIYSTAMPSDTDPNEFVLKRFVRDHADLLYPAPPMNNLTWIRDPGKVQQPHVITRDSGSSLIHKSGPHYLEGAFVELGALMLGNTFPADGVRRIYKEKNQAAIKKLHEDIELLKQRAIWKEIGGDKCCMWKHPLEGRFKDRWGGDDCAGVYHKCSWQIGTAMMVVYANEKDESLLPYIDGVYNWTKHFLYDRNGVCDIPWAMFCHIGLAASENFMLTYRQVFRSDPVRGKNYEEALRLAQMCAYKSTWFYLTDPDETDGMDPTFLGVPVIDRRWIGGVTWNECGWIPRTAIPMYCETGDAFWKYLVRGAAENFFVGYREDGGITENVQIFGETQPKGRRTAGTAGISNGAQMRRWAEPAGASPVRICVGEKAAIAFCKNTFGYDVANYAYKPELNCTFRLIARPGVKDDFIDLTLTAPFRDLRTRPIRLNARPIPKERIEFNDFTDGEDAYIRGVRPGDTIEVGDATGAMPAPTDPFPYRTLPGEPETQVGAFRTINIASACNEQLEMRFGEEGSWYGWLYGLKWRDGIPYYFLDPALNGGRACVKGECAKPGRINFKPAQHIFIVFGVAGEIVAPPTPIARIRLIERDTQSKEIGVTSFRKVDVNCDFPLRKFNAYAAMLSAPKGDSFNGVEVLEGRLFAVTTLSGDENLALSLREKFDADVQLATADAQRGRYPVAITELKDGPKWRQPEALYRVVMDVTPTEDMAQPVLRIPLDLNLLCEQVQAKPIQMPCVVRCLDHTGDQAEEVPAQLDLFKEGRGTLILLPENNLTSRDTRRYVIYFGGPLPSSGGETGVKIDEKSATVTSGKKGVKFAFSLSGEGDGPRLMDLRFDLNSDGKFDELNVLGKTGFSGGYGCLTSCYDPLFWLDFYAFQKELARARVVASGPVSNTIVAENLQLFGIGGPLEYKRTDGKSFPIGHKGTARWFFRTYTGRPYLDQWIEWQMGDADTGWTRSLQVRYGLANFDPNIAQTGGRPGEAAEAADICALAAPEEQQRLTPLTRYTKDGHVVEVSLAEPQQVGRYASNFWRTAPSAIGADVLKKSLAPPVVEIYALERKEGERVVSSPPKAARSEPVSTLDSPVIQPGPEPPLPGTLNWDSSFEKTKEYWNITNDAAWSRQAARTGKNGLLLEVNKEKKLPLVSTSERVNREMALEPNTTYKLTFWARCLSEKGFVLANLYWGPGYDFSQVKTELQPDGKWRRYEVDLPTGNFPLPPAPGQEEKKVFVQPSRIFPALRLWSRDIEQVVHVDDVCLTPKR